MRKRLTQAGVVFVVVFAAAQLVRPAHRNPATDASRTIRAQLPTAGELTGVLDRSCRDCHSNETEWPWYANVAPVSWLLTYGVTKGRNAVNFSDWAAYSPEQQRMLLAVSCDDVTNGKMPGAYTLARPDTRLSARDIQTICAAARQADAHAGVVSR
jgi:hypothetical protein